MKLLNAISLNMIQGNASLDCKKISEVRAREVCTRMENMGRCASNVPFTYRRRLSAESTIGHADLAAVISAEWNITVPANRVTVELEIGDEVVVAQYTGPRLQEGCKTLPDGAKITWWRVEIMGLELPGWY